jgi:large subunit ribosomal protein L28
LHSVFKNNTENIAEMARVCDLSGKSAISGNNVSHSNRKTKRKFYPNLQTKRLYIPEEDSWITVKVSTSVLRTINKKVISAVLKDAEKKGLIRID